MSDAQLNHQRKWVQWAREQPVHELVPHPLRARAAAKALSDRQQVGEIRGQGDVGVDGRVGHSDVTSEEHRPNHIAVVGNEGIGHLRPQCS